MPSPVSFRGITSTVGSGGELTYFIHIVVDEELVVGVRVSLVCLDNPADCKVPKGLEDSRRVRFLEQLRGILADGVLKENLSPARVPIDIIWKTG